MKIFLIAFIAGVAVYLIKATYDYNKISNALAYDKMATSFPASASFLFNIHYGIGVFILVLFISWLFKNGYLPKN